MKTLSLAQALTLCLTAAAVSSVATWMWRAPHARAPEPAMLTADGLSGSNGATGAAIYPSTAPTTTVVKWPGVYTYHPTLAADTPCSNTDLGAWTFTSQVIVRNGNYAKCN
jgi:hypothetical protein